MPPKKMAIKVKPTSTRRLKTNQEKLDKMKEQLFIREQALTTKYLDQRQAMLDKHHDALEKKLKKNLR